MDNIEENKLKEMIQKEIEDLLQLMYRNQITKEEYRKLQILLILFR